MIWLDKLLSYTSLVKSKNKQLQQYSDHISYLENLLDDYRMECIELNQSIQQKEFYVNKNDRHIDYAKMAWEKARLCSNLFQQLSEEQEKNKDVEMQLADLKTKYSNDCNEIIMELARREGEILSLKHMLDRYEEELEKLRKD